MPRHVAPTPGPRRGRPPKPPEAWYVRKLFTAPPALWEKVDRHAARAGMTRSQYVTLALVRWLDAEDAAGR